MILGAGLLLATLGGLVVWAGTAAIDRRAFESMRQRGAVLARLLALACGESFDRARAGGLTPLLDEVTGAGDLVYVEIVDREGALQAQGGASGRRPVYAARGVPLAPGDRDDRIAGVSGEPLYIFTYPIVSGAPVRAAQAIVSQGGTWGEPSPVSPASGQPGDAGFGPKAAGAAPRREIAGAAGPEAGASLRPAMAAAGGVRVAFGAAALDDARRGFALQGSLFGLLVTLVGMLSAHMFARRLVTEPARTLAFTAELLARGDLTRRTGLRSADEIGAIGGEIDALSDRLEAVIGGMQDETRRVAGGLQTIEAAGTGVLSGTRGKREALAHVSRAAEAAAPAIKNPAPSG